MCPLRALDGGQCEGTFIETVVIFCSFFLLELSLRISSIDFFILYVGFVFFSEFCTLNSRVLSSYFGE